MALLLQLRTRTKKNTFTNPSLFHFYTTSNSNDDEPESTATSSSSSDDTPSSNSSSPFPSYFRDVKKVLKQGQSTSSSPFTPTHPSNSSLPSSGSAAPSPSKAASLDEIRKNLNQFRRRVSESGSAPPSSPSSNPVLFQEIYRRNMAAKQDESTPVPDLRPGKIGGRLSFEAIRESVRKRVQNVEASGSDRKDGGLSSLSAFTQSLRKEPSDSTGSRTSTVIGGTALPASVFGKELREKERGENFDEMRMAFLKTYRHDELGEKLRKLRPPAKGADWFSLRELTDRLVKLREMDEKENERTTANGTFKFVKEVMIQLQASDNQQKQSTRK